MHNAVMAVVPLFSKRGTEALGTVGLVGKHSLSVKHICFRGQVFRGMLEHKLIKPTRCSLPQIWYQDWAWCFCAESQWMDTTVPQCIKPSDTKTAHYLLPSCTAHWNKTPCYFSLGFELTLMLSVPHYNEHRDFWVKAVEAINIKRKRKKKLLRMLRN